MASKNSSIAVNFFFVLTIDDDVKFVEVDVDVVVVVVVFEDVRDICKLTNIDNDDDDDELARFIISLSCICLISYSIDRLSVSDKAR
jgi:hypothetical protein